MMSPLLKFRSFWIAVYVGLYFFDYCLYCSNTILSVLLTWVCSYMTFQYFGLNIYFAKLQRPALKVHVTWCKTSIYSWNLSQNLSLMYEDSFPIPLLCNVKYISLYLIHNSMIWSPSELPWFLKLIPGVFGRLEHFQIPKRFLSRRANFPNHL